MTQVDFSLPLADVLRSGTLEAHKEVEKSPGAAWLSNGELDRLEYIRFLMILHLVYNGLSYLISVLETGLEKHSFHNVLRPSYNPRALERTSKLSDDISFLLESDLERPLEWQRHPIYQSLTDERAPQKLARYLQRLRLLSEEEPELLLSHAYIRYLGDLSGGQIIRKRVQKAYNLPANGEGTLFFSFTDPDDSTTAESAVFHRALKTKFRDGLNAGAGDDQDLKRRLLAEANAAFIYTSDIFSLLSPPSTKEVSTTPKDLKFLESQSLLLSPLVILLVALITTIILYSLNPDWHKGNGIYSSIAAIGKSYFADSVSTSK